MGIAAGGLRILTNGETMTIDLQRGGATTTAYSENTLTNAVTLPLVTSSDTSLFVEKEDNYTLSVLVNGVEMAAGLGSTLTLYIKDGETTVLAPVDATTATGTNALYAARSNLPINVKDKGAIGNGVANDTTAITSAYTAAAAAGSSVYFPPGTYLINSRITASTSTYGHKATIKKAASMNALAVQVTANDIVWDGVDINGNRNGSALQGGIQWSGGLRGVIRNCRLYSTADAGLYALSSAELRAYNVEAFDNVSGANAGDGFGAASSGRLRLFNCYSHDNDRAGVYFQSNAADGCEIHDCLIEKNYWGVDVRSDKGVISAVACDTNNQFNVTFAASGSSVDRWQVGTITSRNAGVQFTRYDGTVIATNNAATSVQLYIATHVGIGSIIDHGSLGYTLAITGDGGAVNGALYNSVGSVSAYGNADPAVVIGGVSQFNRIGTVEVDQATVAVSFGETTGAPSDNEIGTVLSSRCTFAIVRGDKGTNNRIGTIIDRDSNVDGVVYTRLITWDGAGVSNNIIGTFQRRGTASPTIFGEINGASGNLIENIVGATDGEWQLTGPILFKNKNNSTSSFRILDTGSNAVLGVDTTNKRLGVGTTAPTEELHVIGTGEIRALVEAVSGGNAVFEAKTGANSIYLYSDSSGNLNAYPGAQVDAIKVLASNGNVGINKATPTSKLDVVGTFAASGNSTIGGTLGVTGTSTLTGAVTATGGITSMTTALLRGDSVAQDAVAFQRNDGTANWVFRYTGNDLIFRYATGGTNLWTATTAGAFTHHGAVTAESTLAVTGTSTFTGATTHNGGITMGDAQNIVLNATTGTKLGTATTQKLGFYNATPIVQPGAYTQTYSTADKTHAADGSADLATTAATNAAPWGFASQAQAENIATQFNLLRATVTDLKQLVNSVIDDLQALGLVG